MKTLVILGAGGHGKVCANIAYDMKNWDNIVFLDDSYPDRNRCLDFDIVGQLNKTISLSSDFEYFVAIGNNVAREKILTELKNQGKLIATLVHPTAYIGRFCTIGEGTSIHQNVVINVDTVIGKGVIVNTNVIVEHENKIGDYVHLSPSVSLGGQVTIGKRTWLGIGTTVINNISIVGDVVVGAMSLVISNIYKEGIHYGIPLIK